MNSKINRIPEVMLTVVVTVVGLLLAVYLGSNIGSGGRSTPLMIIGVMVVFIIGVSMKERIWLLIFIMMTALPARLTFLPLSITGKDAGILLAFGWFLVWITFKRIRVRPTYTFVDVVFFINLAYIFLTYLRNPVGTLILETDRIGGRPYFNILIGLAGYFVLTRATLTAKTAFWLPAICLAGVMFQTGIGALNYFFPSTVPIMAKFYGGLTLSTYRAENAEGGAMPGEEGVGRMDFLKGFGFVGLLVLFSYFRPFSLISIMKPLRFLFALAAFSSVLLSGFRSTLVNITLSFCVATFYHRRLHDFFLAAIFGAVLIVGLCVGQGTLFDLPRPMQRALSFLPGDWNEETMLDANSSKEWRWEMWRIVLSDERYLKNKWLGDGFGYSLEDYRSSLAAQRDDPGRYDKETFMVMGEVHSGPVSAIRFVGYVGLALYICLMGALALAWHRMMRDTYGSPFFPLSLYLGIGHIVGPFFFLFIFGAYEHVMSASAFGIGCLHLIRHGFRNYLAEEEARRKANVLPEKIWGDETLPQRMLPTVEAPLAASRS